MSLSSRHVCHFLSSHICLSSPSHVCRLILSSYNLSLPPFSSLTRWRWQWSLAPSAQIYILSRCTCSIARVVWCGVVWFSHSWLSLCTHGPHLPWGPECMYRGPFLVGPTCSHHARTVSGHFCAILAPLGIKWACICTEKKHVLGSVVCPCCVLLCVLVCFDMLLCFDLWCSVLSSLWSPWRFKKKKNDICNRQQITPQGIHLHYCSN